MTQQSTSLLVGLLAGVAAALLLVSAGSPSSLSFILFAAAAMPILIAGLGWSNLASIVAVVSAMAIIGFATTPQAALVSAVTTLTPAAWIAHLSNLARPAEEIGGPEGEFVWYPLSDIFLNIAACVCVGLVAVGLALGYGQEFVGQLVDVFVTTLKDSNADYQPTAESMTEMKQFFLFALPAIQAAIWVLILLAGWYLASAIVRLSGRSKRPKDDLPSQLRMPRLGAIALSAGRGDELHRRPRSALVGWTLNGGLRHGFCRVIGYAVAHHRTRGKPARGTAAVDRLSGNRDLHRASFAFFFFSRVFDTHPQAQTTDRLRPQPETLTLLTHNHTLERNTTMDVILLKRIAKLWPEWAKPSKRFGDGYARNFPAAAGQGRLRAQRPATKTPL